MSEDHDSPWKEALEVFFQPFLQLLFPDIEAMIDWRQVPVFLDKELQKITGSAESGRRHVDKLARVRLQDGAEHWLLIHTEVQGEPQRGFAERMYRYYSRIRERYAQPVISLAVLTDTHPDFRPDSFSSHIAGSGVTFRFRTCKLLDFQQDMDNLLYGGNPFGLLVAAQLTAKLIGDGTQRADSLVAFYRLAIRQRLEREMIGRLVIFLEWMVALPSDASDYYDAHITRLQEETIMPYVSSFERKAMAKGVEQGIDKGRISALQETLHKQLFLKFGNVPAEIEQRLETATESELARWAERILFAGQLPEVFAEN